MRVIEDRTYCPVLACYISPSARQLSVRVSEGHRAWRGP
jgi:hypothetical protein